MRTGTLLLLAGIGLFQALPALPPPMLLAVFGAAGAGLCLVRPARRPGLVLLGLAWAGLHAACTLSSALPFELTGRDVELTGTVISIPETDPRRTRFELAVESLVADGRSWPHPAKVRLGWYRHAPAGLAAGQRWRLTARLKPPRGSLNPGGFDYERWLFTRGIRATGHVRRGKMLQQGACGLTCRRQRLSGAIRDIGAGGRMPVIAALAVGDRQGIDEHAWSVLRSTGTAHLVAISGLHVGLVAGLAWFIAARAWAWLGFPLRRVAASRAGACAALLAALAYAGLAGFSIPTQRALLMVAVFSIAAMLRLRPAFSTLLALALSGVLLADPQAVLSGGFWLSFCAVGLIGYAMGCRPDADGSRWWRWGRVHAVIAVGLAPLLFLLFGQAPVVAPLANAVAVPWVSFLVVPLTLAGAALLLAGLAAGGFLLAAAAQALDMLWPLLEMLADWQAALDSPLGPSPWAAAAAMAGAVLLLAPRGLPGRWAGLVFCLPLLFPYRAAPASGEVWLDLLDVGQGLAAVVRTRGHALVFDAGPRFAPGLDAGRDIVVPFLRHAGIGSLDMLVISHGDNDHIGGARSVIDDMRPAAVFSSVPDRLAGAGECARGHAWQWDGVRFEFLHPRPGQVGTGNNRSCVLRVTAPRHALLLTGDIEQAAERQLVAAYGQRLRADILVAPHHGSKTSSSAGFIEAVSPCVVLYPAGWRNRWDFPARSVQAGYARQGAVQMKTGLSGAVSVQAGAGGVRLSGRREQARRYWHTAAPDKMTLPMGGGLINCRKP